MFQFVKRLFIAVFGLTIFIYILLVFMGGGFGENRAVSNDLFLFAHRGVTDAAPENSLAALSTAKQLGFNAIEIDIQETSDKELILFHDDSGERLLKKKLQISDTSYEDLQKLSLYGSDSLSQHKIITLEKVFDEFGNSFIYYLDLKCENQISFNNLAKELNVIITKHDLTDNVIIASSNIFFIGFIEYYYPKLLTILEGFDSGKEWIYTITPKLFRPDLVASFYNKIDAAHIKWLKKRRLLDRKIVYGVPAKNQEEIYKNYGITKMIVDYHPSLDSVLQSVPNFYSE